MIKQICNKCNKEKKKTDFHYFKIFGKEKIIKTCKSCLDKINRDYEKRSRYQLNRKRKFKEANGFSLSMVNVYGGFDNVKSVFERDNYQCQTCGKKDDLVVHHKDLKGLNHEKKGGKMNNDPSNLIVLCRRCHGNVHIDFLLNYKAKKKSTNT